MATDHNFRIKNGLEVGGQLIVNSSGQLVVADVASNLDFADNIKARFGNGADLRIWHDGTDSHIQNTQNNGVLRIRSQETYFLNSDNIYNIRPKVNSNKKEIEINTSINNQNKGTINKNINWLKII